MSLILRDLSEPEPANEVVKAVASALSMASDPGACGHSINQRLCRCLMRDEPCAACCDRARSAITALEQFSGRGPLRYWRVEFDQWPSITVWERTVVAALNEGMRLVDGHAPAGTVVTGVRVLRDTELADWDASDRKVERIDVTFWPSPDPGPVGTVEAHYHTDAAGDSPARDLLPRLSVQDTDGAPFALADLVQHLTRRAEHDLAGIPHVYDVFGDVLVETDPSHGGV